MGSRDHAKTHANTPQGQPQTPANNTPFWRAATTTKARHTRINKNRSLEPSISSLKPRKIRSPTNWDSQTTLTQIDYVRGPPQDDEPLDYIENDDGTTSTRKGEIEVIDLEDESSDGGTEYHPSSRRTRETRTPRAQHANRDKSTGRRRSSIKGNRFGNIDNSRKSKTMKPGKSKEEKGRNKTLTQMDFVRRFIILDDSDDDRNLEYIERNLGDQAGDDSTTNDKQSVSNDVEHGTEDQGPRKKRKLSNDPVAVGSPVMSPSEKVVESPTNNLITVNCPILNPSTPRKCQRSQKLEIPSSQSPESPAQLFIPSPHLRDVPRFPRKPLSSNTVEKMPEMEKTTSVPDGRSSPRSAQSPVPESLAAADSQCLPLMETGAQSQGNMDDHALSSGPREEQEQDEAEGKSSARFEKTVVYETDAETEDADFDDTMTQSSQSGRQDGDDKSYAAGSDSGPHSDDSQDLPPPVPNSGTDLEGGDGNYSDLTLPSDASLLYRRIPQHTQFPAGPVPLLNTQRIAELFPPDSSTQQGSNGGSTRGQSSPPKNDHSDILCPQTQTQTQSQDPLKMSTEVVPESSPVQRDAEDTNDVDHPHPIPPPQESVVLVESSQPVDRINRHKDPVPEPRRLVSAGQWLTDSVMESIPAPPWQLSQDSIGEPYPLPEG